MKKEEFLIEKNRYEDTIVLVKSGAFCITFDNDASILSYLFLYQVNGGKVGFPIANVDKVLNELDKLNINYVCIFDDRKKEHTNNKYNLYLKKAKNKEYNDSLKNLLIDKINVLLDENITNFDKIRSFLDEL